MIFNFKINKKYLLVHALRQRVDPFKEWADFKNYLWKISKNGYDFLIGSPEIFLEMDNIKNTGKIIKEAQQLIKKAIKRKEFKKLYKEAEKYKLWLEKEWNKNEKKILKWVIEISGLKLPKEKIIVLITHPKLYNGKILPDKNIICWGHPEDWKNYSIIYLIHELMHIITKEKLNSQIIHALIELLADNEMRIRLNKKSKYFKEYKSIIGHSYLLKLEKKILPEWKKFLKDRKNRNLYNLEKDIKKKVGQI